MINIIVRLLHPDNREFDAKAPRAYSSLMQSIAGALGGSTKEQKPDNSDIAAEISAELPTPDAGDWFLRLGDDLAQAMGGGFAGLGPVTDKEKYDDTPT